MQSAMGLKIALVQLAVGADKAKNITEAVKQIQNAKSSGAQLVALPECFNSPYGTGYFEEYAEEVPSGATCQALSKAAAESEICVVGGTLPERCGDKIYNTCTVWDDKGRLLVQHRKRQDDKTGLKLALVQTAVGLDKRKNVANAVTEIYRAKEKGCDLIVLPELFNSFSVSRHFESIPNGETSEVLSKAAADTNTCIIGGTIKESDGNQKYNTVTVWGGHGEILATYRKMHLFDIDIPGKVTFRESEILSPGDQLTTFDYLGVRVGLGVCYDLRFQEMSHLMAQQGCSLLIYPGAFSMTTGPKHWELLGRARAIDHQLWVALVSPARDTSASYVAWGHSTLIDPWGDVVAKLDEKPGMLVEDIDLQAVADVRAQIPIRKQRRTDIYDTVIKQC